MPRVGGNQKLRTSDTHINRLGQHPEAPYCCRGLLAPPCSPHVPSKPLSWLYVHAMGKTICVLCCNNCRGLDASKHKGVPHTCGGNTVKISGEVCGSCQTTHSVDLCNNDPVVQAACERLRAGDNARKKVVYREREADAAEARERKGEGMGRPPIKSSEDIEKWCAPIVKRVLLPLLRDGYSVYAGKNSSLTTALIVSTLALTSLLFMWIPHGRVRLATYVAT